MKIVELSYPMITEKLDKPVTLVLGFFDGVHLGHQKVIEIGKKDAVEKDHYLAVMSFNQHPSVVFTKNKNMTYLTDQKHKIQVLASLGVDVFYIVSFTSKFANLSPKQFVEDYIIKLGAKTVVAGFDYHFGKQAAGDVTTLEKMGENHFETICVDKLTLLDQKISSTEIRAFLADGDVESATKFLGRPYINSGVIVHGDARGRTIGYPTANIEVISTQVLPKESIYVVEICVNDTWYKGMASIGRNVSFEANRPVSVEVHIFDFNDDIYGEHVTVRWLKKLRSEIKFDTIEALIDQLKDDEKKSRAYFNE